MARFHFKKVLLQLLFGLFAFGMLSLKFLMLQKRTNSDKDILGLAQSMNEHETHRRRTLPTYPAYHGDDIAVPGRNEAWTAIIQMREMAQFDQSSLLQDANRWRKSMLKDLNETLDQETLLFGHVEANRRLRMNRGINFLAIQRGNTYVPYRDIIVADGLFDRRSTNLHNSVEIDAGKRDEIVGLRLSEHAQRLPHHVVNYSRDTLLEVLQYLEPEIFQIIPPSGHFFPGRKNPCFQKIEADGKSRATQCLPYVYLGGAPKSATTDVWQRLQAHPDVITRLWVRKEPHFWTRGKHTNASVEAYLRILAVSPYKTDAYRGNFAEWKQRMVGVDGSADTLFDNLRVARALGNPPEGPPILLADVLRAVQPDAKFIFILRDPVERLYSDFLYIDIIWDTAGDKTKLGFHRRVTNVIRIFEKCLRDNTLRHCVARSYAPRINVGMYSVHLREWFHRFPRDQILILRTEQWATNTTHEFERIRKFLDLSYLSDEELAGIVNLQRGRVRTRVNQQLGPMWEETKRLLDEFYRPYNEDLSELLGDDSYMWRGTM